MFTNNFNVAAVGLIAIGDNREWLTVLNEKKDHENFLCALLYSHATFYFILSMSAM